MVISRKTFEDGLFRERERHHVTWEWVKWYFEKRKKLPKDEEFFLHLAQDNLKKDEHYYD